MKILDPGTGSGSTALPRDLKRLEHRLLAAYRIQDSDLKTVEETSSGRMKMIRKEKIN
jgi:hypothetical protein